MEENKRYQDQILIERFDDGSWDVKLYEFLNY